MLYCNLRHVFLFYWGIVDLLGHVLSQHSYPRSLPCFSLSTPSTAWHPSSFFNGVSVWALCDIHKSVLSLSVFLPFPFIAHSLRACLLDISFPPNKLGAEHNLSSTRGLKGMGSLVAQRLKRLPAVWETQVQSLGPEDPLEKEMATHSSTLAWEITEEPGGLQSMGSQRVGHNWATSLSLSRGK